MAIGEDKAVQLVKKILELDPIEFLGVCKILGVSIYKTDSEIVVEETADGAESKEVANVTASVREFSDIWNDVCDAIDDLNKIQKRNLNKLLKAATKVEK